MEINIPYTYLHLSNLGTYMISVFAETNPGKYLDIKDVPLGLGQNVRKVELFEGEIGSRNIDLWAQVSNVDKLEINVPLVTKKGVGPWKTNTARLFAEDQENIAVPKPDSKVHLPHLYLISEKFQTTFTLYIAIQTRNGYTYEILSID
ncbi:MAG: hypothetical protein RLZZ519_3291, partial [Bacteroidota bacterium]